MGRPRGSKNKRTTQEHIKEEPVVELLTDPVLTTISGYINVYKHIDKRGRVSYFTGGDIHKTPESARLIRTNETIGQVFISLEVK